MKEIGDHLQKNLDIVFIGFNPSIRSGETGHHYANPNNRFWKVIHEAGLTPRRYRAEEDSKLLELGYGLTNIVSRPTKAADEITKDEYRLGREELRAKLAHYRPKIACFVGKGVYQEYSGKRKSEWGVQKESMIGGIVDFVAPSSSGLVRMKVEHIVDIYRGLVELKEAVQ
ncbi:G/U mismatch-specific DNA glycosylase [Mesobacillus maritimus]|uniref:G/U mismatch-specific DNA glycosylase n=1 Tax=Mesobacillus maritimus TaxID=1643336 RepID=UPI00203D5F01|nr:G/U mismatch-specific DNA glycosylase [Mesobacillus maritimus]MCM3588119.1 G/U mismatch-specific DNA glycosylase [Mesobacillus maritimus]MCM3668449.1 G/U mismatch-specific DNA glycosylase [Mesobacillus maritimus]